MIEIPGKFLLVHDSRKISNMAIRDNNKIKYN